MNFEVLVSSLWLDEPFDLKRRSELFSHGFSHTHYLDSDRSGSILGGAKSSGNAGDPNHPNHKVGGGQNLCFSKKTFFFFRCFTSFFPFSEHFSSPKSINTSTSYGTFLSVVYSVCKPEPNITSKRCCSQTEPIPT